MNLKEEDIRRIVRETIAEERRSAMSQSDENVINTIAAILSGFGIDNEEKKDIKEDFRYLRRWRKGSDRVTGVGLTALVTLMVGGLVSAIGLGIKSMLGK